MQLNPVWAVCGALGMGTALFLPLVRVAPNRLMSGEPLGLAQLLSPTAGWAVALTLLLVAPLACGVRSRCAPAWPDHVGFGQDRSAQPGWAMPGVVLVLMALGVAALLALAGQHASQVALTESPYARTSFGAGFWSLLGLALLVSLDALRQLPASSMGRSAVWLGLALPSLVVLGLGWGNDLSLLKEYANRSDVFWQAVLRHGQIVLLATLPSVLLGLALAWACARHGRLQRGVLALLNLIQTIPSIALFGLFMAPLAWVAARYPVLAQAGISGVGLAPAVLALLLYSLLPLVRSALAALAAVPVAVKTAAQAMGMSSWQILWRVELPLAWPVLLPGLRTAVTQTIGLAAVTALVGAGGLGALMFEGLFSAANDLVLLGVLPIVLMAVLADALFKGLTMWASPSAQVVGGAR
jgi:osmoprotectant transport system permease protein